jgi:homogentisate 1,2-dioxygenase
MYRTVSSLEHNEFVPLEDAPVQPKILTPNSYFWPSFAGGEQASWIDQKLLARNGDPGQKQGVAMWLFNVTKDMDPNIRFSQSTATSRVCGPAFFPRIALHQN